MSLPGPAMGFLQEAVRWWDHWLKDAKTGIMDEPMLRFWLQDRPVRPDSPSVPGRWAAEAAWPVPDMGERTLHLTAGKALAAKSGDEAALVLRRVVIRRFVEKFGAVAQDQKAVRETRWNPQLTPVFRRKHGTRPLAKIRRIAADIHGHVKHFTGNNAHQFALCLR